MPLMPVCEKALPPLNVATEKIYYYLRDAQGNEMARYSQYTHNTNGLTYEVQEHAVYGSSRTGIDNTVQTLYTNGAVVTYNTDYNYRQLGMKSYELSNHLGNVLVTISDKKVYKSLAGTIYFEAEITAISDYYPFGSAIATRAYSSGAYRYGFNNQEKDSELGECYAFEYRIHDARLGRFLSVDPLSPKYPWNSCFSFAENRVIIGIDLEGLESNPSIKAPAHYEYFTTVMKVMFEKSISQSISTKGALWVIAQAIAEQRYKTNPCGLNFFGLMNNGKYPDGCKTGDGTLIDFTNIGGIFKCIEVYFEYLNSRWPEAIVLMKKGAFTADDINRAFYPYNYYEPPSVRAKTGHGSYHGNDITAPVTDYGKYINGLIKDARDLMIKCIDFENNFYRNQKKSLQEENDKLNKEYGELFVKALNIFSYLKYNLTTKKTEFDKEGYENDRKRLIDIRFKISDNENAIKATDTLINQNNDLKTKTSSVKI